METWFIADTHFSHKNMIKYAHRPFSSVEEMDETMITNWNALVRPKDIIYHLGDFAWTKPDYFASALNGKIILILGNHDYKRMKQANWTCFNSVYRYLDITIDNHPIALFHYSLRVWNKSHFNAYALFGHSHGRLPPFGKSFDVGVDCWNFQPINFEIVKNKMETLDDNPNLLKGLR